MPDLVAQGPQPEQLWRRPLPADRAVTLGRGQLGEWAAPWDENISRLHATLRWQDGKLLVQRNPSARNPVLYRGQKVDQCALAIGDFIIIGRTRFTLAQSTTFGTVELPSPLAEFTLSAEELLEVRYSDAADRIEVL